MNIFSDAPFIQGVMFYISGSQTSLAHVPQNKKKLKLAYPLGIFNYYYLQYISYSWLKLYLYVV